MAEVHPVKFVYDAQNNVVALSEYVPGDEVPTAYLNKNMFIDGGAIPDRFKSVSEHIDGGVISDTFSVDSPSYDGGKTKK
jgi:hypothetical protein